DPHKVERRCTQHLAGSEVIGGSGSLGSRSWRPARRLVACRRVPEQERAKYRHHKEDPAQNLKGGAPAKVRDQVVRGQWPKDCRPCAVSAYRQPYRQSPLVGEPLRHHWDWSGVAETVAQSPEDAEEDEEFVEAVGLRTKEKAQAYQYGANQGNLERSKFILQPASDNERQRENHHRDDEHIGSISALPVEFLFQRGHKYAPGIQRAQRQVHGDPTDDVPPTI